MHFRNPIELILPGGSFGLVGQGMANLRFAWIAGIVSPTGCSLIGAYEPVRK